MVREVKEEVKERWWRVENQWRPTSHPPAGLEVERVISVVTITLLGFYRLDPINSR